MVHERRAKSSKTYLELLTEFPPRPITSEAEAVATQRMIDALLDQSQLTDDEVDYLSVLGSLVHEYEQKAVQIKDIYGVELLEALIEERGLRQKDLVPIFKTESIVSAILNGKRKFTVEHIQKLADYFKIAPTAFFPVNDI
ncbi:MAG: helix-turn-helix domain-containing protein [Cyanobacteria bacterium P01_H01_bin.26]